MKYVIDIPAEIVRVQLFVRTSTPEPIIADAVPLNEDSIEAGSKALKILQDITKIIYSDTYIQEDVLKYQMIKEIIEADKTKSEDNK